MGPGCWRKGNLRPPTSCPQGQLALWIPELSAGSGRCRNRSAQKGSCSFHPKRKGSGGQELREEAGGKERLRGGAEEDEPGVLRYLSCSPVHSGPENQAGVVGRDSQHSLFPYKTPAVEDSWWSQNGTEGMTSKADTRAGVLGEKAVPAEGQGSHSHGHNHFQPLHKAVTEGKLRTRGGE